MFVIVAYDIKVKRVSKIRKICKKYLFPIQKSVFEGDITEAKLARLKNELMKNVIVSEDSIVFYEFDSYKYSRKCQLGVFNETARENVLL